MQKREHFLVAILVLSLTIGSALWIHTAVWSANGVVEIHLEKTENEQDTQEVVDQRNFDPRININTATVDLLTTLPGIGPVLAQRIITYREDQGEFAVVDDLIQVSGIGVRTLESLEDLIRVE